MCSLPAHKYYKHILTAYLHLQCKIMGLHLSGPDRVGETNTETSTDVLLVFGKMSSVRWIWVLFFLCEIIRPLLAQKHKHRHRGRANRGRITTVIVMRGLLHKGIQLNINKAAQPVFAACQLLLVSVLGEQRSQMEITLFVTRVLSIAESILAPCKAG